MAVLAFEGTGGHTTYLVADEESGRALVIHPDHSTAAKVYASIEERHWVLQFELRGEHRRAPAMAHTLLQPMERSRQNRVLLRSPVGPMRLRIPSDDDSLSPDGHIDTFVVRVGRLQVYALACSLAPAQLAWRIGPAVFTNQALFDEGVWPAAATPLAVLRLPPRLAVYPRIRTDRRTVSTVGRERECLSMWRRRGYDPSVPDPSATLLPPGRIFPT